MCDSFSQGGWLKKRGFMGIWSSRYCVMLGTRLIVSKDENREKVDITINITPACKVQITTDDKKPRFAVEPPSGSAAVFEAADYDEMMKWVLVLRGVTFSNPDLNMSCFETISIIGRGYYGKVRLVKSKETAEVFAIKSIRKSKLIEQNKIHTVLSERNIMAKSSHPFIVTLKFAFQTPSKFYLGLEYVPGGELFQRIYKCGFLKPSEYRLIIAQIAIALHHLHSIGIIYRDIKPENILIAADGYIKLTDFGLAKDITVDDSTSTFCGTPEYIAPEVIQGLSYDKMVDWWALGILTYELIYHHTPFKSNNKADIYNKIVQREPKFPVDANAIEKEFISGLLDKNPAKRFKYEAIIDHPFFHDITFEKVLNKEIVPDYIPRLDSIENTKYFDPEFTNESKAESYVAPIVGNAAAVPGFSYTDTNFDNMDQMLPIMDSVLIEE